VPKLELRDLVVPERADLGATITVTVNVANTGTGSGTGSAILVVNGVERDPQSVSVEPGATQGVAYTFTVAAAGTHTVAVKLGDAGIGPKVVVVPAPTPATPTGGSPTPGTPPTPSSTPPVVTAISPPATTPTSTPPINGTPTSTSPDESVVPAPGILVMLVAVAAAAAVLVRRR
jgi:hypothetical protein